MRRHISWILGICCVVFAPHIYTLINYYNIPDIATLYQVAYMLVAIGMVIALVIDCIRHVEE